MKKIILTLAMGILLMSCSNEPIALETSTTAKVVPTSKTLITASTTMPSSGYSLSTYESCTTNCIAAESSTYFEKTDSKIVSWGGLNNDKFSKTIYIKYFNTRTEFKLLVLSTEKFADLVINGASVGIGAAANTWGEYSIPLESGWKACDTKSIHLQVAGDGPQGVFDINYGLVGMCASGCETVFSGKAISCGTSREVEYTFTSKEAISNLKIQGGLTNFTGANATVTVTGGTLNASQRTPGGSSNRVITVEGSVDACEKITINIKWDSSNSGGVITGSWSASGTGITVDEILGLECR
ncbi:hypothetical protein SAMN05443667_11710 [Flavobacterium gillisiae]|uniref:Uncharacterized protein n=1 Tax=Flavobacterium gillisiae TaxID=150146 RepID=A0A1H4G6C2_9FLAO|nr:hypothetical protein [Flavobacterium gillisiae]SEB05166.1 hypothetical protein SAMN05443667_11710 [Flavobacterium gillisiae]